MAKERILAVLTIESVNSESVFPVTISPPAPWLVVGTVQTSSSLVAMAYQVDAGGPIRNFEAPQAPPNVTVTYICFLTEEDVQTDGPHTVFIHAWDDPDGYSVAQRAIVGLDLDSVVEDPTDVGEVPL